MFSARTKALVLLLGVPLGFAFAVLLGRAAERYSKPDHFVRFHYKLAPETLYYPTFSTMENLALARYRPGKTLVVIAGNSILNGFGQEEKDVWSLRLQEQLGERYAVVNLSFRGTLPCEGASLVAESLLRRGLPVILVTNTAPNVVGRSAGGAYGYLYWDAFFKGRLTKYLPREQDIAGWEATLPPADLERQNEFRRAARLDALFHYQTLWHHVGYRHLFTVWSPHTRERFLQPRASFPDDMPGPAPLNDRFRDYLKEEMEIVRGFSSVLAEPVDRDGWRATEISQEVARGLVESMFVPALRPHTIMIQNQNAPFYRARLTPSERARDDIVFVAYEQLWRKLGIACHTVGTDFENADFRDRTHLTASGGEKLATLVAGYVRQLNPP